MKGEKPSSTAALMARKMRQQPIPGGHNVQELGWNGLVVPTELAYSHVYSSNGAKLAV